MIKNQKFYLLIILLLAGSGCSTASSTFDQEAKNLGFKAKQIKGLNFKHTVYENGRLSNKKILHVYLGGDGSPWFQGRYITDDPTPLNPVMLKLMKMDNSPSIYLGRPCYHQTRMSVNCDKSLWTNKRYSLIVVDTMEVALKKYTQKYNYKEIKLFGFSGGGTLAMLLAARLQKVSTVVTLAGNINTDAWTAFHGYLPLIGSLNPSKQPSLPSSIRQFHMAALVDKNVPANMIQLEAGRQNNATFIPLRNANHHCCWGTIWRQMLVNIQSLKRSSKGSFLIER